MIKVILLRALCHNVTVLLSNLTFVIFFCFRCVFFYICCFSIFPSNLIVSGRGMSIFNQFRIRRPAYATSSSTWTFDLPLAISYSLSFGTKCLSPAVFEILGTKHIGVTTSTGSRFVIGHMTIRLGIGHFLLVVLRNQVSTFNGL